MSTRRGEEKGESSKNVGANWWEEGIPTVGVISRFRSDVRRKITPISLAHGSLQRRVGGLFYAQSQDRVSEACVRNPPGWRPEVGGRGVSGGNREERGGGGLGWKEGNSPYSLTVQGLHFLLLGGG